MGVPCAYSEHLNTNTLEIGHPAARKTSTEVRFHFATHQGKYPIIKSKNVDFVCIPRIIYFYVRN